MSSGRPLRPVYHDSLISVHFALNPLDVILLRTTYSAALLLLVCSNSTSSSIDDGHQARKEGS